MIRDPLFTSPTGVDTIRDVILRRFSDDPPRPAFIFLEDGDQETRIAWSELARRSLGIAALLQERRLAGERALLLFPPGLDFVPAFLGCIFAGVVAVPAYPPRAHRPDARLRGITSDCDPRAVLTTTAILARRAAISRQTPELEARSWIATDAELPPAEAWRASSPDPRDLAFLQYTSGSTARPKGVMVTHANLMHNERMIETAFGSSRDSVVVGWLPLYHDMGLIGNVLHPLFTGGRSILMSPVAFLKKPVLWLRAISSYRATISGGPNFSYELCVRKIRDADGEDLDLSCWSVAFNGAEPVRAATLERFSRTFAPHGFKRKAFYPCYGLAEATLFVAGGDRAHPPTLAPFDTRQLARGKVRRAATRKGGRKLVGCGHAWTSQRIAIVDAERNVELPLGEVGEIWIRGLSVAAGYWDRQPETELTFRGRLEGVTGTFLRTGDLGFVEDGELFVTGRLKELIIIHGRNHYPHDLEATAEGSHAALRSGSSAAFAIDSEDAERLVLVLEVEPRALHRVDLREVGETALRAVAEEHEIPVHELVLVAAGSVPKTSSGKVRRLACREQYLDGRLAALGRLAASERAGSKRAGSEPPETTRRDPPLGPRTPLEATLSGIFMEVLERSDLGIEDHFFELGGHSLSAAQAIGRVEEALGIELPMSDLFRYPTVARLAERIETVIAEAEVSGLPEISPQGRRQAFPLSFAQRRLWFLEQMAPGSKAYHLGLALRLAGRLEARALATAVDQLVARHELLRTAFENSVEGPRQRPLPARTEPLPQVDLSGLPDALREKEARDLAAAMRDWELAFVSGIGLRRLLIRIADQIHIAAFASHHLVLDGSQELFVEELAAAYREAVYGDAARAASALDYADFAVWERRLLGAEVYEHRLARWRRGFHTGEVPVLALPTDRPRPSVRTWRGASLGFHLDGASRRDLGRLCQDRGVTPYMALLAVFQTLLHRCSAQSSIWVGSPMIYRPTPATERLLGCFMNTVVLAADLERGVTFESLLAQTSERVLHAFAHRGVPFEMLVRELQPDRDLSRTPLFQVMFTVLDLSRSGAGRGFPGLEVSFLQLPSSRSRFDLLMSIAQTTAQDGLDGFIEFDTDLFDKTTVERLAGQYRSLLAGALAAPAARLFELSMLVPAARQQVLREWNDTAATYDREVRIEELFEARVDVRPEAVAVEGDGRAVTYRELDRRAAGLARRLGAAGAGPATAIGVYLERSPAMVVALLGILKVGGAYVPLSLAYPPARLRAIIGTLGIRHLVTQRSLATDKETAGLVRNLICADLSRPAKECRETAADRGGAQDLAYVIFTSGSTGTPKGVMVRHRPVVNLIRWVNDTFGIGPADRVLFTTSIGFDLSVYDVFGLLAAGGTVRVASDAEVGDPARLVTALRRERVTFWDSAPAALQQLMPLFESHEPAPLRRVFLSGDWIPVTLPGLVRRAFPSTSIISLGGATEATVWSNYFPVDRVHSSWASIPYGRAIANARYYVLDGDLCPRPAGAAGDLYIGGSCLSDGYAARPELTAPSFVPDRFGGEPGGRLYRTGDQVRHRADGVLEFLGRLDHQVKIRGFRIELGEVQAVLAAQPGVGEAVVVAVADGEGPPAAARLVAYVSGSGAGPPCVSQLRDALAKQLPLYMVPSAFVTLARMPLTASGKIDRKALPPPEQNAGEAYRAPMTAVEDLVAGIWAEVLEIDRVGADDNFFALGGHSLLAVQVVSRLREVFGVEVSIRQVFEAAALRDLSAIVEDARSGHAPQTAPLVPAERSGDLPLSFAQQRLWFLDQLEPGSPTYNVPVAVRLRGPIDPRAMASGFGQLVRRHETLRTRFPSHGGEPVQEILAPRGEATPTLIDLSGLGKVPAGKELERLGLAEARRPFDLARGPLFRVSLLRRDADEHVLLLVIHHIVADALSLEVLFRDLASVYAAAVEGRRLVLPELPVQYADYAVWQRSSLTGEELQRQLAYWRGHLTSLPALLELPLDRPRPAVRSPHGGTVSGHLPPEVSAAVAKLSRRSGTTAFMALLAVLKVLLFRLTGRADMVVGSPVAGRNRPELRDLIGFFVNTLVLRTDLSGDPSFRGLLARTRRVALAAYSHQEVPFEKLVEAIEPERDRSHAPLVQVMFQHFHVPPAFLELAGLELEVLDLSTQTAKFDLSVNTLDTPAGMSSVWHYSADLFDETTVLRFNRSFRVLAEDAVARPEQSISSLTILPAAQRHQLLEEWGEGPEVELGSRLAHQIFEAQALATPERLAAVFRGSALTYRELDGRAENVASALRGRSVGSGDLVALLGDRGTHLLTAILGVWKTGGAYLPLDPRHPAQRIARTLESSRAQTVLTDPGLDGLLREALELVPPHERPTVAELGDLLHAPRSEPAASRRSGARADDLAYVIYTSGSTGAPKGAMVTHRGMLNHLAAKVCGLRLTAEDAIAQTAPLSFDISVWQLVAALLVGGRVHVFEDRTAQNPLLLVDRVEDERISVLETVPSLMRLIVDEIDARGDEPRLARLRWLIPTGEALPAALARRWLERYPEKPLLNAYGPTECSDDVTHHLLAEPPAPGDPRVPIGRPLQNTYLHVLDPVSRVTASGAFGELLVGGAGVGRGYLADPRSTAEVFVPNSFSRPPGQRLYRTADLVRFLPDGRLDFLERRDYQVKVRGLRIELGEIEAALLRHPEVREAAALVRTAFGDEQTLVAYTVWAQGSKVLDQTGLRTFLARTLPDYMLPDAIVVLDAMPLLPSGKVDRRALPEPVVSPGAEAEDFVAPRNPVERFLARLWRETLGLAADMPISVRANFFQLGGNSIRGAVLTNRVQRELGEVVHVVTLFDSPTVERFAEYLVHRHPRAVERRFAYGTGVEVGADPNISVDAARVAAFQARIALPPGALAGGAPAPRNPPAVFVLAPPRSGTTLLRVMLGGHPKLFAPPELELLGHPTLAARRAAFPGRDRFRLEGLVRAVMECRGLDAEAAERLIAEDEAAGTSTQVFYGHLQSWLRGALLVDKTPSYCFHREVLEQAETMFEGALYIHLVRHPCAVIHSYEEARLDQIYFQGERDVFSRREMAELAWLVGHQNILSLLRHVAPERQIRIEFETLIRAPEQVMKRLCAFLAIDFDKRMLDPYEDHSRRMTDGIHAVSRMAGDVKFHSHRAVDPAVADRWRREMSEESLGEPTREMAASLGHGPRCDLSTIRPLAETARPRLSFAQERLWFLDRLDPGRPIYNMPSGLRIAGPLRPPILERSFAELARRHACLRTSFHHADGGPVQVVGPGVRVPLPEVDLSSIAGGPEEAERLASRFARLAFDLERAPLLRLLLLSLGAERYLLVLVFHHIVSDGWSLQVLVRELAVLYGAQSRGEASPLPPLTLQYRDFADWQRRWLAGEIWRRQLAFWRHELRDVPHLQLPTDRPRPATTSHRGTRCKLRWPAELVATMHRVAQSEGASLFMVLLAGLEALLGRYSGQTDFAVGTAVAGRDRAEVEDLIGFFVNTLVLRSDLAPTLPFRRLLARVRRRTLDAFAHQELPFERLVGELRPERDLSTSPLFQVLFVLQNAMPRHVELPGLAVEPVELTTGTAKFDLDWLVVEAGDELVVHLEYAVDLFDATTAGRLLVHLERLLGFAAGEPERNLADLPLLSSGELHHLTLEWNDTGKPRRGAESCLHGLFETRANSVPDVVALIGASEWLTYRELDRRATALARELRRRGVGPEVLVGVAIERAPAMVVGLMAVLKAGGAYVPLDASHPAERLAFILEDAGVALVLTGTSPPPALRSAAVPVVAVDGPSPAPARSAGPVLRPRRPGPDNLAYVIYTSGSTGVPKGVSITHRSPVALIGWSHRVFGSDQLAGVLASTSLCFDLSVFELFVPLARGGTVVIAEGALDLPDHPGADHVRLVNTVPSAINELLRLGGLPPSVITVNLAGEALRRELVEAIYGRPGIRSVYNLYGPSEDTTYSSFVRVPAGAQGPPTIGRPVEGTEAQVLGPVLELLPPGAAGELFLTGAGLARGYLGRPALSAERFVPDGRSRSLGGRAYRTGDLVRYRKDGEIEFLGRIDHQIKLRGFRIELGEIEAVLRSLEGVREAVVLAFEEVPTDRRLVAYVVTESSPRPAATELAARLGERLPSYQIPGDFVFLSSLPLNPNGKIDRRALLAPSRGRPARSGAGTGELTPTEEVLAGIFRQVLNRKSVGRDENFFALGGHSLLATQVVSRVRELFALELPLRSVFQYPTLRQLSLVVDEASGSGANPAMPEPEAGAREGPAPLAFAQEQLWLFEQMTPGTAVYNMPAAIRLTGRLEAGPLERSIAEILLRHDALRARFEWFNGQPVQIAEALNEIPFVQIDLTGLAAAGEAEAEALASAEARRPFDLGRGLLLRSLLIRLAPQRHLLLLTTHHIVCDGWSLKLLEQELTALYGAFSRGEPSPLASLSFQYADFARWQRLHLTGRVMEDQLTFWKGLLADAPPTLEMPADRRRPPIASYRGGVHRFAVPGQVISELHKLCWREGLTLFMVLLAAFSITLQRFTGQSDLVIGSGMANRHRRGFEGLIGLLVNMVALRLDLAGDPHLRELLAAVREMALAAYAFQDLPFKKLVEELGIERDQAVSPVFQVMLLLQNASPASAGIPDLAVTPLPLRHDVARFDLVLFLFEDDETLQADLSYNTDLFDAGTVEFLSATFLAILAAIPEYLQRRISALPLVDEAQQESLVGAFMEEIEA